MLAVLKHPENSRQDHDSAHNRGQRQSLSENQIAQQRCEHNTGILIDTDLGGRCLLISICQQILAARRKQAYHQQHPHYLKGGHHKAGNHQKSRADRAEQGKVENDDRRAGKALCVGQQRVGKARHHGCTQRGKQRQRIGIKGGLHGNVRAHKAKADGADLHL